ncbi:MAG: hypothetical protein KGL53_04220 [Elusimicrobia bacterium]|nr:hypothetical protein [Elusimicrobiota bacterium]
MRTLIALAVLATLGAASAQAALPDMEGGAGSMLARAVEGSAGVPDISGVPMAPPAGRLSEGGTPYDLLKSLFEVASDSLTWADVDAPGLHCVEARPGDAPPRPVLLDHVRFSPRGDAGTDADGFSRFYDVAFVSEAAGAPADVGGRSVAFIMGRALMQSEAPPWALITSTDKGADGHLDILMLTVRRQGPLLAFEEETFGPVVQSYGYCWNEGTGR